MTKQTKHFIDKRLFLVLSLSCLCSDGLRAQTPSAPSQPPSGIYEPAIPAASDKYPLGPDSLKQSSALEGITFKFELSHSNIFPDTLRTITVYVPAAYKGDKPACLYVGLDGLGFNAPTVFDNLIAQHAMPVTIAIGIGPGVVMAVNSPDNPRYDRSMEFDSRNDRLARFLLDEVLPALEKQKTPDGRPILLSSNPDDRAIGGGSTGGIGSFTVAWERPSAFHRVFISIGTFVGMRGGEQYYVLVRKTEPKPLRIFMQDGVHDEWSGAEMGDWWMSNLTMERALSFAGYDVRHIWGTGGHNGAQATAVFPDAMRWLWKDWPAPIGIHPSSNRVLKEILQSGQSWQAVAQSCSPNLSIATDATGRLFYTSGNLVEVTEFVPGAALKNCEATQRPEPFAVGPDGKRYIALADGGIAITSNPGDPAKSAIVAKNLRVRNFTVRHSGDIYATVQASGSFDELWLITPKGEATQLKAQIKGATGLAFSPDGLWLFVAQTASHLGLSFRVLPNGQVDASEPFYEFAVPASMDGSGAGSVAMDDRGHAYVATPMGVQIFDRNGRVAAILPLPENATATGVCFGGNSFDTLYVSAGNKIYSRRLQVRGASPWAEPHKLPPWGAG
jgi:enterochelin esterase-like enzyme